MSDSETYERPEGDPVSEDGRPAHLRRLWTQRELTVQAVMFAVVPLAIVLAYYLVSTDRVRAGFRHGEDFIHFYVQGRAALVRDPSLLYDRGRLHDLQLAVDPLQTANYAPVYGPQVSLLFAPLALVGYSVALWLWRLVTVAAFAWAVRQAWRASPHLAGAGVTVAVVAAAYPGLRHVVAYGQASAIPLVALCLAWLGLRSKRDLAAGAAFSLLLVKPQLGLVFAVWAIAARRWRLMAGGALFAGLEALIVWTWFGSSVFQLYARAVLSMPALVPALEPNPAHVLSLHGLLRALVPPNWVWPLWGLSSTVLAWWVVRWCRKSRELNVEFAVLLGASVLVSPHMLAYDTVVLAPALVWLADWSLARPGREPVAIAIYAFFVSLVLPTAPFVRFEVAILVLLGLVLLTIRLSGAEPLSHKAPASFR